MKLFSILAVLLALPLTGHAADSSALLPVRWLPAGTYGAPAATLHVTPQSTDLDLPCAHGHIPYRPVLNSHGTFVAEGSWESGPITPPGTPIPRATFRGQLRGNSLWIRVQLHNHSRTTYAYGPLVRGRQFSYPQCL